MRLTSIASRLGLAALLFLAPMAFLLYALLTAHAADIEFARAELRGLEVLRALGEPRARIEDATLAAASTTAMGDLTGVADRIVAAATPMPELRLPAAAAAAAARGARDAAGIAAAAAALRVLVGAAGDSSNLILDPQIDTYYLTDIVLGRLPDAMDRVAQLVVAPRRSEADRITFYVNLGGLKATADGLDGSAASAFAGNPDGGAKVRLGTPAHHISQLLHGFIRDVQAAPLDAARARATLYPLARFATDTQAELGRLLTLRIDGLHHREMREVGVSLALFGLCVGAVLTLVVRGVIRPLGGMTKGMLRLADGDLTVDVPRPSRRDEIGALASAMRQFKANATRVVHMAHHDALTGLPNRLLYRERIDEILKLPGAADQPLTVLLLDLDHFKEVNDTLGHGAGDALLKAVAMRLRACMRETDIVARLGGDEFAIVLHPSVSRETAGAVAARIVQTIGEPYGIDGERVMVGASVGLSAHLHQGATSELLLKFADMALYQAKANGRATWCFYEPTMDLKVQTRRAILADLGGAIANNQLQVRYQPVVELATGRPAGFEALLRWQHPHRGMVSPSQFIPLAEESGLIEQIGAWVLRQACLQATRWPADLKIAVNLSPRQIRGRDVARAVSAVLDETGLAPEQLELEITESLLLQDHEDVLLSLRDLRDLGVGVALDDFGTGYASLSYLRKFPFSKLKIDQSFVRGMEQREDCIIIIQSVAALAHRLGMLVTAEGIETEEQLAIVREAGCTLGQGYLFSRPATAAEAGEFLYGPHSPAGKPRLVAV